MSIFYGLATRALYFFLKKLHEMAIFPVLGKLTHMGAWLRENLFNLHLTSAFNCFLLKRVS